MLKDPKDLRILFLRKKDNQYAQRAEDFIRQHFQQSTIFTGGRKDKLPEEVLNWKGDMLVSFISSWIYPQSLLSNASFAAINFIPAALNTREQAAPTLQYIMVKRNTGLPVIT